MFSQCDNAPNATVVRVIQATTTARNLFARCWLVMLFVLVVSVALGDSIAPSPMTNPQGGTDVTWGLNMSDQNPLMEIVPPSGTAEGMLVFNWTKGDGEIHPDYRPYIQSNATTVSQSVRLFRPADKTITDWKQTVTNGDGTSDVRAGNLKQGSPWSLQPLDDIAGAFYRIPDLAPTRGGATIYTAVNLDLYLENNPEGFLNGQWLIGQTLRDLGITITDGQIPGLAGILWGTSEFVFDPESPIGWSPVGGPSALLNSASFESENGDTVILAAHTTVPEPSAGILVAAGCLGLMVYGARCRYSRRGSHHEAAR